MQIPADVASYFRDYLLWIFSGIIAVFLYNYFAALLRAVGNSLIPLVFLIVSALLNIALDLSSSWSSSEASPVRPRRPSSLSTLPVSASFATAFSIEKIFWSKRNTAAGTHPSSATSPDSRF